MFTQNLNLTGHDGKILLCRQILTPLNVDLHRATELKGNFLFVEREKLIIEGNLTRLNIKDISISINKQYNTKLLTLNEHFSKSTEGN